MTKRSTIRQVNVPGFGLIRFRGVPLANKGTTDTIVERQEDANLAPGAATVRIQVTKLSLESIAPVTINGLSWNVFVSLDPAQRRGHHDHRRASHHLRLPLHSVLRVDLHDRGRPNRPPTKCHCRDTKDQNANSHTGRPTGTVDFYAIGPALHMTGGGQHVVVAACQSDHSCSQTQ